MLAISFCMICYDLTDMGGWIGDVENHRSLPGSAVAMQRSIGSCLIPADWLR